MSETVKDFVSYSKQGWTTLTEAKTKPPLFPLPDESTETEALVMPER